jgi:hypothetical protein
MESGMSENLLIGAGVLGMMVAAVHGYLSQTRILPAITGLTRTQRRINAAVYHLSTLYWAVGGAGLVWAAISLAPGQQALAGAAVGFLYASAALANAWATRGRHPGGPLLGAAAAMAIAGAIFAAG